MFFFIFFIGDIMNRKEPNNREPGALLSELQTLPWDSEMCHGVTAASMTWTGVGSIYKKEEAAQSFSLKA